MSRYFSRVDLVFLCGFICMARNLSGVETVYCTCVGIHTRSRRARLGNYCHECGKPFQPIPDFFPSQGELSRQIVACGSPQGSQHIYSNISDSRGSNSSLDSVEELQGGRDYAHIPRSRGGYLEPRDIRPVRQRRRTHSAGDVDGDLDWFQQPLHRVAPFGWHMNAPRGRERMYGNITPPKFSGLRRECPKLFFSQFQKYTGRLQIPDGERVQYLGCLLDKGALELYDSILEEPRDDGGEIGFLELKARFLDNFVDQESDLVTWNALHSRKLRSSETVREYYDDLRRMNAKLEAPQEELLNMFMAGLPTGLKRHLIFQRPGDVREAVRLAVEYESVMNDGVPPAVSLKDVSPPPKKGVSANAVKADASSAEFKELREQMKGMQDLMERLAIQKEQPKGLGKQGGDHLGLPATDMLGNGQPAGPPAPPFLYGGQRPGFEQNMRGPQLSSAGNFQPYPPYRKPGLPQGDYDDPAPYGQYQWGGDRNVPYDQSNDFQRGRGGKSPYRPYGRGGDRFSGRSGGYFKETRRCFYCNTPGHLQRDCYKRKRELGNSPHEGVVDNNTTSAALRSPGDMTVDILIGSVKLCALIDTGSHISIVRRGVLDGMPDVGKLTVSRYNNVISVGGHQSPILGSATVSLALGNLVVDINLQVLEDLHYSVILGRDFLQKHVSSIDIVANELVLVNSGKAPGCTHVKLNASTEVMGSVQADVVAFPEVTGKLARTWHLKAHATAIVQLYPNADILAEKLELLPLQSVAEQFGLEVSCGVVDGTGDTYPCKIRNKSATTVTLRSNLPLVRVKRVGMLNVGCSMVAPVGVVPDILGVVADMPREPEPIAHDLSGIKDSGERHQLGGLLDRHRLVFAASDSELGCVPGFQYEIDVGDAKAVRSRFYRANLPAQQEIDRQVQSLLENGIIRHSKSEWASPVLLVQKKDGSKRLCVDYRKVNDVTRNDSYPLPLIKQIFDSMGGAQYFSALDLRQGYHQMRVHPNSQPITAFICKGGLFEYLRLPFGLKCAPSAFMRMMECVLREVNYRCAIVYLDDVIIYTRNFVEHLEALENIFSIFESVNLRLKPSKCRFLQESIEFLGHVLSKEGIATNPNKIALVQNCPAPTNRKQLKSFLGLANYYRRFVDNFSKIAAPLHKLLRKDVKYEWSHDCENAFLELKTRLISAPILGYPDLNIPFHVSTDASSFAIGMVLGQVQDGHERVIEYAGRSLTPAERNYTVGELETLAAVEAVKGFHHYLHAKFTLYTDNTSVAWLMKQKVPKNRIARWLMVLQGYDFEIVYKPGKKHGNADGVSRIPSLEVEVACTQVQGLNSEGIRGEQREDNTLIPMIQFLEENKPITGKINKHLSPRVSDSFHLDEGGLLWKCLRHVTPYEDPRRLLIPKSMRD